MRPNVSRLAVAVGALCLSLQAGFALAASGEPTHAEPINSNTPPGTEDNFDVYDNVCRGNEPRCYLPWVEDKVNRVLL